MSQLASNWLPAVPQTTEVDIGHVRNLVEPGEFAGSTALASLELKWTVPFMTPTGDVPVRQPGLDVTGPVPVNPPKSSLPVEQLLQQQKLIQASPIGAPAQV